MFFHLRVLGDFEQCHEGTDAQTSRWSEAEAPQFLDILHVHQSLGMDDVVLHQSKQIASAGKNLSIVPLLSEKTNRLLFLFGTGVFEGSHARPPSDWPSSAARTRSGVSGK